MAAKALEFTVGDPVIHKTYGPARICLVEGEDAIYPYRLSLPLPGGRNVRTWVTAGSLRRDDSPGTCPPDVSPPTAYLSKKYAQPSRPNKATKWHFNVRNPKDINFAKIRDDMSYKRPIALVTAGEKHYVCVHPQLVDKSVRLGASPWPKHSRAFPGKKSVFVVAPSDFNDWIEWARGVKQAPWGGRGGRKPGKLMVNVVLPEV